MRKDAAPILPIGPTFDILQVMKVLQILPALQTGGVERGTIEVARALQEAGVPNAVASQGGRLTEALEAIGVPHFQMPLASKNPFVMLANASRLAKIVSSENFTLMHVRSAARCRGSPPSTACTARLRDF